MIKIKSFVFNPFMENTYILYDETKECIVIDPGCYEDHEQSMLSDFIKENGLKVIRLLNTHCHIDHVLGNEFVKKHFGVPFSIHKIEGQVLEAVKSYAPNYGFASYRQPEIDSYLEEGKEVTFGNSSLSILFVPGHSPGHVAFYNKEGNICIGGDVLFKGSIGRTDLPGGDHNTLIKSIRDKIIPLGDDVIVYSGHGPLTKIGDERKYNPFLN